ncbi:MAG: TetR/AcrR family transcriptional regulator [Bacteroidales bacterium]|nr:TetR/AcrR family transcriptional regulator [Bacteroidales bacterium]MDY0215439.1 TetR/AcrR family transcriptional regulator [Bacteroidales bacterium]
MNTEITERQQEIIDVSLDLIAEGGIQSLTMKNLAKKIGFAESAIYRHFENKIQILLAILDFFKQNTEHLFTNQIKSNDNALIKIENLFQNHFKKFSDSPSLVSVIFSEEIFRNEIELTEKVKEIMGQNITSVQTIIETGQKNGEIRNDIDASHLSVMIMGSLRMFVKQWHMSDYKFNITEKGSAFIKSIVTMLKN